MPQFAGAEDFKHDSETRIGVMLVNLGTPDEPTAPAVRRYLDEFLSDPRVVEFPRIPWWLIMNLFILRFRPRRVAKAYASVWEQGGSPLLVHSQNQAAALQEELDRQFPERFRVALAMRYGNPAIRDVLDEFRRQHCRHLVVIPMFPQYSATTTASIFDEVTRVMQVGHSFENPCAALSAVSSSMSFRLPGFDLMALSPQNEHSRLQPSTSSICTDHGLLTGI